MNLHFWKIRFKNFLSTGNLFTEIDLSSDRMTLIVGENGAGKSTMLDALCFVLFNKPFRKINKPQLINSITKRECVVEIEFSIRGSRYKIVRGMKPVVFEIWKNDVLINQDSKAMDYQAHLEKSILKTNFKTFCQIVILGSASYVPFMQLPTGQRREITEDLLDLQIFTSMNGLLKNHISRVKGVLDQKEREKDLLETRLDMLRSHTTQLQEEKEKQIADKEEKIIQFHEQLTEFLENVKIKSGEVDTLMQSITDSTTIEKRIKKLQTLRIQLESKASGLRSEIKFLHDHENCPTCNQLIEPSFKESARCTKTEFINEIEAGLVQLSEESDKMMTRASEISAINKSVSNLNTEIYVLNTKIDSARSFIKTAEHELKSLKSEHKEVVNADALVEMEKLLEQLIAEKGDIEHDQYMMDFVSVHLKDTGVKARIIKKYIPIINKLINKYLAALDFFVDFNMDENFEETIKSRGRDDFSYNSFSEGEKMRIDLAVLFTWRAVAKLRSSINTNLLIMDEVFDGSLDAYGTEEFMKVLTKLTDNSNIFIISHKTDALWDKFLKIIKFEKVQNFSRMS